MFKPSVYYIYINARASDGYGETGRFRGVQHFIPGKIYRRGGYTPPALGKSTEDLVTVTGGGGSHGDILPRDPEFLGTPQPRYNVKY